jgi:hypothetical protein
LVMTVVRIARLGQKTTGDEELEQSHRALPKTLICPLPYRIINASGSGDPLPRSPVHVGRDEVGYGADASREKPQNPKSCINWMYLSRLHGNS